MADMGSQLQEQERVINISYALASEASQRSKQVAGEASGASLPTGSRLWLHGARGPAWLAGWSVGKQTSVVEATGVS